MAPKTNKNDAEKKPLNFKLLVIGDSGVGKSNIINVYVGEPFQRTFITTIGVDFKTKLVKKPVIGAQSIPPDGSGGGGGAEQQFQDIKLNIWDTAGQEKFRTITTTYYRGAQGILVVFDLSSKQSFMSIKRWVLEMEQNCRGTSEPPPAIILGNKCDIAKEKWEVSEEEIQELRRNNDIIYLTSAATGENLESAFSHLTEMILQKRNADNKSSAAPFSTIEMRKGPGGSGGGKSKKKKGISGSSKCQLL